MPEDIVPTIENLLKHGKGALVSADSIATINYSRENKDALKNGLSPEDTTFVISASSAKVFVTGLMNTLYQCEESEVILFGEEKWMEQKYVEMEEYQKLRFSYVSPAFVDYNDSLNYSMIKQFRDDFLDEPYKFAFMGYDVSLFFSLLLKYGHNLKPALDSEGEIEGHCMNLRFPYIQRGKPCHW